MAWAPLRLNLLKVMEQPRNNTVKWPKMESPEAGMIPSSFCVLGGPCLGNGKPSAFTY